MPLVNQPVLRNMVAVALLVANTSLGAPKPAATDSGYVFAGPVSTTRTKALKNGLVLVATHQSGVIVSTKSHSPWHHATFFAQTTVVKDSDGNVLKEVALCETTDADGDLTFGFLWRPAGKEGTFQLVVGTGKWEGISGGGRFAGVLRQRVDGHVMPKWQLHWKVDKESSPDIEVALNQHFK